jgi:hypothetical protein
VVAVEKPSQGGNSGEVKRRRHVLVEAVDGHGRSTDLKVNDCSEMSEPQLRSAGIFHHAVAGSKLPRRRVTAKSATREGRRGSQSSFSGEREP